MQVNISINDLQVYICFFICVVFLSIPSHVQMLPAYKCYTTRIKALMHFKELEIFYYSANQLYLKSFFLIRQLIFSNVISIISELPYNIKFI